MHFYDAFPQVRTVSHTAPSTKPVGHRKFIVCAAVSTYRVCSDCMFQLRCPFIPSSFGLLICLLSFLHFPLFHVFKENVKRNDSNGTRCTTSKCSFCSKHSSCDLDEETETSRIKRCCGIYITGLLMFLAVSACQRSRM